MTLDDDTLVYSGTPTRSYVTTNLVVLNQPLKTGNTYNFKAFAKNVQGSANYRIWGYNSNNELKLNVVSGANSTATDDIVGYRIVIENMTVNVAQYGELNIQIEQGSTATDYKPYQSQSYPISLASKNYCDGILEAGGIATSTGVNEDLANRIRTKNMCKIPSGQITISVKETDLSISIRCYDNSKAYLGVAFSGWGTLPNTFTPLTNTQYIRFVFKKTNDSSITVNSATEIQVESGSTATSYEEFWQIELAKISTYKDKIYNDDNDKKWYLRKEIGKVVLNGSESWGVGSSATSRSVFSLNTFTNKVEGQGNFYCDIFSYLGNAQTTYLGYAISFNTGEYKNYCYAQVPTNVVTSQDNNAFKTWLSSHNATVYYPMITPTVTEITDENLINQLEAVKLLSGTQNNFTIDADTLPTLNLNYIGEANPHL